MHFVNRQTELSTLNSEYVDKSGRFVVLYGRRRLGKTRLLREFFRSKIGLFYVAIEATPHIQRTRFKDQLAVCLDDRILDGMDVRDWETLFAYLGEKVTSLDLKPGQKFVLIIDEFQYLVRTDPGLPSILQQVWDHKLQNSPIMLILCGSAVSMMHEHVLNASSPLYGRRTAQIRLRPVEFSEYAAFIDRPVKDRLALYGITGGVPRYIELIGDRSLEAFISDIILDVNGYLYAEPHFLLSDEIRQYVNYFSILQAISRGHCKVGDIASFVGLSIQTLGPYLEILKQMHLLERRVPITEAMPHKSRRGLYRMADSFAAFWFRYIPRYTAQLEQGQKSRVLTKIMGDLPNHMGPIFEEICRKTAGGLNFWNRFGLGDHGTVAVGSWWDRNQEIDVVAFEENSRTLLLGECKLGAADQHDLDRLKDKGASIISHYGPKRTVYALFAENINRITPSNDCFTFDLEQLFK